MKNYPMQYSLVYFAPLKEWGGIDRESGGDGESAHI